ncbi:MAG: hypothetical protein KDB22_13325 [Planctomycetales bacterium]|nr:hypothetical protein [Planctomycetales bacterium]
MGVWIDKVADEICYRKYNSVKLPQLFALAAALSLLLSSSTQSAAQDEIVREEAELVDQEPFDLIVLKREAGGQSVKVFPIPFPNRQPPSSPNPSSRLTVVLVRFPEREYEVAWRDIDHVELYEQRIYDEAGALLDKKDFAGAMRNLSYLMKNYPQMGQLELLRQKFLFRSAADRFNKGDIAQSLSALEELRDTAPSYQPSVVMGGLSRAADMLVGDYQEKGDLASAKIILARLESKYGADLPVVASWKEKLDGLARQKMNEATQLMEKKEYRAARRAAVTMLGIVPDFPEGQQIIEEINRLHPMVRVGVMQQAGYLDPASLTNWPARRAGALVTRTLFQFRETGAEGGQYDFALGTFELSEDRQQLFLTIDPAANVGLDAFSLGQLLVDRANVDHQLYDPSWAAIFHSVSVPSAKSVIVQLRRPNVLPYALMQWMQRAIEDSASQSEDLLPGAYVEEPVEEREAAFRLQSSSRKDGQPVEIVEVFYEDPKAAVNDLLRGEIDVLDQLYPADARRLAADRRLTVGAYALPTSHMLIPVSENPFLANIKFRRALLYSVDRKSMLEGELLNSTNSGDGRLISGPFPLGDGQADLLAYAYNAAIEPADYSPQLARLLMIMATEEIELAATKRNESKPKLGKLTIGCPNFEFARVAVQAMVQQWKNIGIDAEVVLLPAGVTVEPSLNCDLVYAVATMWEPATDIERLLGGTGVAASDNPFIVRGLEQLRAAKNWREVRDALQDLHQLVHYHLPILPLWQVTDRLAVSRHVRGVEKNPVSLYHNVASWRVDLGSNDSVGTR